jgi:hypothetical protein
MRLLGVQDTVHVFVSKPAGFRYWPALLASWPSAMQCKRHHPRESDKVDIDGGRPEADMRCSAFRSVTNRLQLGTLFLLQTHRSICFARMRCRRAIGT